MNIVFQIHKWRKYCEIIVLKTSDSYCYFLSWYGRKKGAGADLRKLVQLRLFHLKETLFLIQKGHYKKNTCSFAEKAKGLDPQDPLVARLTVLYYTVQYYAILYCTALYCTLVFNTMLYSTVLH